MAFEPENPLEKALLQSITDPAARPDFYRLLMASHLYALGRLDRADVADRAGLHPDDRLTLRVVRREGESYYPVFSALSRLHTFVAKPEEFIGLVGRDLFASARGAQFVLNPGSEAGKTLAADEIEHWLDQLVGRRIDANTRRTIVPSRLLPARLVKALGVLFVNRQVTSARLAEILADKGRPRTLLAVETESSWRKISHEIATVVNEAMPGLPLELVRFNPKDTRDAIAQQLNAIAPFYVRRQFQEQKETT